MRLKRIVATVLAMTTIFTTGATALANVKEEEHGHIVAQVAEKYDITEDEVTNLNDNIKKALQKAESVKEIAAKDGNTEKKIQVSENLVLVLTTKAEPSKARAAYERTITATMELQNIFGGTVIELNSVGVFNTNGSTSKPIDAYGTYDAWVWNVTNTNSTMGSAAYNAWVRNSFSGEFNIGIDPVSMTIQSFNYTCKIYCNAVGTYSASWS